MTYSTHINVTEEERKKILNEHSLTLNPQIIRENIQSFRFTSDMKYVVFENNFYSCETGELMPLTEKWSVSDILHTVGDVASLGMDFIVPGSGAIVDAVNGTSYFIEAIFTKDATTRKKLFIMGAITLAFVIIPGPLQAVAIPMKRFVKYGAKKAMNKTVLAGLEIIYKNLSKILSSIPRMIQRAVATPLGKKVLGKYSKTITTQMDTIITGIKSSFDDLITNARKAVPEGPQSAAFRKKEADKIYNKKVVSKTGGIVGKTARRGGRILRLFGIKKLDNILRAGVPEGRLTGKALRNLGMGVGGKYKYVVPKSNRVINIQILKTTPDGVICRNLTDGSQFSATNGNFIFNAVAAPWVRRGKGKFVPFFIKRLTDVITPEGQFDEQALAELPDLDPSETSLESLNYIRSDVGAEYQGHIGKYTVNPVVQAVQKGLVLLGYSLPSGEDGKFGPETKKAVEQFQTDASLESFDGAIDRLTARKLALELRARGIPNSEDLQNELNNI